MKCNICDSTSEHLFQAQILNKHEVNYYTCSNCGFIQTELPFWLEEAYQSAITSLDIGLVQRNIGQSKKIYQVIARHFDSSGKFLDYGGGYGLFVRLMRDKGLDFYRQDIYCANLFANYFDLKDLEENTVFELLTAFEVFEHLPKPIDEFKKMQEHSSSILFSTLLQPQKEFKSVKDWWYFTPETGQHVALYTEQSLKLLAEQFNCYFYTNGINIHLISSNKFNKNPLADTYLKKIERKIDFNQSSKSLQEKDLKLIKRKLNEGAL